MNTIVKKSYRGWLALLVAFALIACDQMQNVTAGVGKGSKSNANEVTINANSDTRDDGAAGDSGSTGESAPQNDAPAQVAQVAPTKIRLSAFKHFKCSSNWTNRDGGWGLRAGSGSGVCTAVFPGAPGKYQVVLMAQLEFDGGPKFKISVDGATIAAGAYPFSKGELICDCPEWRVNCPDRIVPIDAGVHKINNGSKIEFLGQEVYPCGGHNGAYVKWHELVFIPAG